MGIYGYALGKLVKKVLVKKGHLSLLLPLVNSLNKNVMVHYFQIVFTYIQNNLFSFWGKALVSNGLPIKQLNHLPPQMEVMLTQPWHT